MRLRNVRPDDVDAYIRMRCDPVMMAELGGPQSAADMQRKAARDALEAEADREWILMILPDSDPNVVAGTIALWSNAERDPTVSEIGWMVLPEFQGHGLAKAAVRQVLDRARMDGRWGDAHAFPSVSNGPSNTICRALGFLLLGREEAPYAGHVLRTNHWKIPTCQEDGLT